MYDTVVDDDDDEIKRRKRVGIRRRRLPVPVPCISDPLGRLESTTLPFWIRSTLSIQYKSRDSLGWIPEDYECIRILFYVCIWLWICGIERM